VAIVQVVRVITLTTGEQQANAKVEQQITGKPIAAEILIWNGDLFDRTKETVRTALHKGRYLVFLDHPSNRGYPPCMNSAFGFAEVQDGIVRWRGATLKLSDVLRDLPRSGIEP
jgi:hypothetical protein